MKGRLYAALEAVNTEVPKHADERDLLIAAKVRGLVRGYHSRWREHDYQPLAVEQLVTSNLYNPDTQAVSRTFRIAGKIDLLAEHKPTGRRVLFDHKTTSQDITDPNATYWRQLAIEGQASHYMLLEWLNGRKVDDAVWDVTRKPNISPKRLTKAERAAIASLGTYCNYNVSETSRKHVVQSERENYELYEIRLANDCIRERPEWYFQRRPVPRLDAEIFEYAQELWIHSQDMIHTRRTGWHVRNPGACMTYGSPCQFLGICSGHDSPDSDRWQRKPNVHVELPDLDGDGKDVLTNSRIRCFQTCRKKHYFQYELGIERQDEEEREALVFGRLYHLALNSWWAAQIEGDRNDCNQSAGNELAHGAGQAVVSGGRYLQEQRPT